MRRRGERERVRKEREEGRKRKSEERAMEQGRDKKLA